MEAHIDAENYEKVHILGFGSIIKGDVFDGTKIGILGEGTYFLVKEILVYWDCPTVCQVAFYNHTRPESTRTVEFYNCCIVTE
jgi:hypothetical protein